MVEAEGRRVLAAEDAGLDIGWRAADCKADPADPASPSRVYLGSDGVMIPHVTDAEKRKRRAGVRTRRRRCGRKCRPLKPLRAGSDQGYKEFKLVVYYDQGRTRRHVSGTRGDHRTAGRLMRRDATRLRLDEATERVAIVDGAKWINGQIEGQGLPIGRVVLDFYHLAENVHKARRGVYGEGEAGQIWASGVLHEAKHGGYATLWAMLLTWCAGLPSGAARAAGEGLTGYVSERKEMICYPECVAKGWDMGSGPTEAMCKATTLRLKGVGKRWDGPNAEAVMALSCLEQSALWQAYWASQRQPTG